MALFGSRKKETNVEEKEFIVEKKEEKKEEYSEKITLPAGNISTLQYGVKLEGNIDARGSLVIGGDFKGEAVVEDTVFIENNANFKGKIKAKSVKIAGTFEGEVDALFIEVSKGANFKGLINATKTFLAGDVLAIIKSTDVLEVLPTGVVEAKEAKSSNIKILGKIHGRVIASELLEVTSGGSIEGTIVTKGIKTEQGGTVIGNIQTYDESIHGIDISYKLEDVFDTEKPKSLEDLNNISKEKLQKYAKKEDKNNKNEEKIEE